MKSLWQLDPLNVVTDFKKGIHKAITSAWENSIFYKAGLEKYKRQHNIEK